MSEEAVPCDGADAVLETKKERLPSLKDHITIESGELKWSVSGYLHSPRRAGGGGTATLTGAGETAT